MTVYSTMGALLAGAQKEAMKQYGIKLETVGGTGGDLELRIKTEQQAGASSVDLFLGGWTNQVNTMEAGYGQAVTAPLPVLQEQDVWKVHPSKYEPKKNIFIVGLNITPNILANTDQVMKGEIQSFQDLLDPKWRDRMTMTDPRTGSGPGSSGFGMFWNLGEEYWKKLAAQRPALQIRYDIPISQVAYGEKALAIFPAYANAVNAIIAGAPMRIVHLKEGTSYYLMAVIYVKNAPHPNAAMVLLNWMLSREGQTAAGRVMQNTSVRKDIAEDWLKIAELRSGTYTLLDPPNNLDPSKSRKSAELSKTIFGAR